MMTFHILITSINTCISAVLLYNLLMHSVSKLSINIT